MIYISIFMIMVIRTLFLIKVIPFLLPSLKGNLNDLVDVNIACYHWWLITVSICLLIILAVWVTSYLDNFFSVFALQDDLVKWMHWFLINISTNYLVKITNQNMGWYGCGGQEKKWKGWYIYLFAILYLHDMCNCNYFIPKYPFYWPRKQLKNKGYLYLKSPVNSKWTAIINIHIVNCDIFSDFSIIICYFYFWFWAITDSAQGLFLIQCSEITPLVQDKFVLTL